jgi:hypothetical protein
MAYQIMGIDPGISPAVAVISNDSKVRALLRISRVSQFTFDAHALRKAIRKYSPDAIYLETMVPIAGQGLSSTAALMSAYGTIIGLAVGCRIPYHLVQPVAWKNALLSKAELGRHIKDPAQRKEHQKASAVKYVSRHYPYANLIPNGCRKPDHNLAEALLIATYGLDLSNA